MEGHTEPTHTTELLDEDRLAELDDRIGVLAAQLHMIGIELAETFARFERGGGLNGSNYRTAAHWLSVRTKLPVAEARRVTAIAKRIDDLPTLTAAAHDGRVSLGVIASAARVTTPDNEAKVADIALATTPAQSARILATYRALRDDPTGPDTATEDDGDPPEPLPPEPSSWWRLWYDDTGRGRIDAALDPATAALVEAAWDAARAIDEHADHADDRSPRPSPDEIAGRLARTMLDHAHDAGLRGPAREHFNVQVTVDLATLTRVLGLEHDPTAIVQLGSQCFLASNGRHLADHELAEVLCDATLQVLIHHEGAPLWMGNETRAANRHQRRALAFRSGGRPSCEFPGCTQIRFLHAHHVTYHRHGGRTSLDNLVLLCGHHHREVHHRHWTITSDGDQRFTFWNGKECLGTTCTAHSPPGRPPDLQLLPDSAPPLPRGLPPTAPCSDTGGEHLTPFALDVYLTNLLAA